MKCSDKYPIQLHWVEDEAGGYWYAYHPDWGHAACSAVGDTVQEAVANLDLVRADMIQYFTDQGYQLPVISCPPWKVEMQIVGPEKTLAECFQEVQVEERTRTRAAVRADLDRFQGELETFSQETFHVPFPKQEDQ